MHLIDNGTQGSTTLPTPQSAVGTPGYAASGTPGTFTPTVFDPDIGNTIIAELVNIATSAGAALSRTDNTQCITAIKRLAGGWSAYNTIGSVSFNISASGVGQFYQTPTGASAGYAGTIVSASLVGAGAAIGIYNTSSSAMTLASTNFNTAFGTGGSITIPSGATVVLTSDATSWNATGGSGAVGSPVKPQTASGVGQWTSIQTSGSGSSSFLTMPSGGTWAYWASNNSQNYLGVAAGGTNVAGPFSLLNVIGFCWRIA